MIRNIDNCVHSLKHGEYGGASGLKEGVIIDGQNWLIKYPKNARSLSNHEEMQYTNDPTSEYIGSHIYKILGFDVHDTILVERNNKIAVACKDFLSNGERLVEIRTLKNIANDEMADELERRFSSTSSSHVINLEEMQLHLEHNSILIGINGISERFYDQIVVDAFINNSDRNNGNWGIIRSNGNDEVLAPIYDNGASFNGKTPDSRLERMLNKPNGVRGSVLNGVSVYGKSRQINDGEQIQSVSYLNKDIINLDIPQLQKSLISIVPVIEDKMDDILDMIDRIDSRACSDIRKTFYKESLKIRLNEMLIPACNKAKKNIKNTEQNKLINKKNNIH